MAENSKIEWCDHTVNLWWGCYEVHKGCDNCYAKTMANRYHGPNLLWQQQGPRMIVKNSFADLLKYQKRAAQDGSKLRIFINSMSDLFEKTMPMVKHDHTPTNVSTGAIRNMFFKMVPDLPNLELILLTKRPSNISALIPEEWHINPPENVIFMTSVVDQETANTLVPLLMRVPGRKGLSMEPLVDRVLLKNEWLTNLNWVIVGGESGHGARPMNKEWALSLLTQCRTHQVPYFFKQWGEWTPLQPYSDAYGTQYFTGFLDGEHRSLQNDTEKKWPEYRFGWHPDDSTTKRNISIRVGKKLAGAMLGHNTYKEFAK